MRARTSVMPSNLSRSSKVDLLAANCSARPACLLFSWASSVRNCEMSDSSFSGDGAVLAVVRDILQAAIFGIGFSLLREGFLKLLFQLRVCCLGTVVGRTAEIGSEQ